MWEVLGWTVAVCAALVVVALTVAVVVAVVRSIVSPEPKSKTKKVM